MKRDRETYLKFKSMADDLRKAESWCDLDGVLNRTETMQNLYKMGYRKQSEGEWKDRYNGKYANPIYVCSLCGKGTLLTPYINELNNMEMTQALSPYCPNCGAKMKGGE